MSKNKKTSKDKQHKKSKNSKIIMKKCKNHAYILRNRDMIYIYMLQEEMSAKND